MRIASLILALLTLWLARAPLSLAGVDAATQQFEPARFRTDNFSLLDQIQFPAGTQDVRVALPCTASVSRQGRLSHPFCLATNLPERPYRLTVLRAVERAKVTPGRVNGKAKRVVVKFTVIFERKDGKESVYLVPNQMLNAQQLGSNYIAPQLIRYRSPHYPRTCIGTKLILRLFVNAQGVVSDPSFHLGDDAAADCIKPALERAPKLRFIPGMVNGRPAGMHHLYLMGWRGH